MQKPGHRDVVMSAGERVADAHDVVVRTAIPGGLIVWECGRCNEYWIPRLQLSAN